GGTSPTMAFVLISAASLAAGLAYYLFYERAALKWARGRGKARRLPAPVASDINRAGWVGFGLYGRIRLRPDRLRNVGRELDLPLPHELLAVLECLLAEEATEQRVRDHAVVAGLDVVEADVQLAPLTERGFDGCL